jgi:methylase of polypeptide subunit release factors
MIGQTVQGVPDVNVEGYKDKQGTYFGGVRRDFLDLLPKDGSADVLEIGCGSGETGAAAIAAGLCRSYTGVKLAPQATALARTRLTKVLEGDVEKMQFPSPMAIARPC